MAEERRCVTCGHYVSDRCVRPGGCCFHHSKWQPIAQEKPMGKIQHTKEEWSDIYELKEAYCSSLGHDCSKNSLCSECFIIALDKAGYIRKSAVEEAEEMYKEWLNRIGDMSETVVMDKMYLAIQEQKKENVRLSNLIRDSRE
jgi:hypothetical protein